MDDIINETVVPLQKFAKSSQNLLTKCTKPDWKEFSKIGLATLIGFAIMGFIGFFVKLTFIPINNIIVSS